ncbi:MAG: pyridoxal phosphate-dependent aminotransferase [Planctomycetota bacterium]|jgi:aspartate aminotransferase/aminotransferase|nr:pyridoxal phosphate-dependent aminotransferase [Planctomycetota bacterium]
MTPDTNWNALLAGRMANIDGSGVRRMFDLIRTMDDPINLSIGQADYDPPEEVKEAACAAIRGNLNRYSVTEGRPALNGLIVEWLEQTFGARPDGLFSTSGVSGGLLLAHLALINAGDEVLLSDPSFVIYKNLLECVGAKARYYNLYPTDGGRAWHPDFDQVASLVNDRTKAIVLNSPSNPTGGVLDEGELAAFRAIAERHGLWLFADEIYSHFAYDAPFSSMITHMADWERTMVFGGFSKTYGVPGWRLGWVAGPGPILERMKAVQQYTFVCPPTPLQHGAMAALSVDMTAKRDEYRKKRDRVAEELSKCYELTPSEGSFYAFPAYPRGFDEESFIGACLERKLLVVPGSSFSRQATHFRLSFAVSDEMLDRGIDVLREIAGG